MKKQQRLERRYFEMFSAVYALPPGAVTYADKPDVRVEGERTLGIEITNLFLTEGRDQASEQVQQLRRELAVSKAHQLYKANGGNDVELTFSFKKSHSISDSGRLAEQLAALGKQVEDGPNGQINPDAFKHIPELQFAYLCGRELQYSDEPDPMFPDGAPDGTNDFVAFAEYRNRREARALGAGVYKPLAPPVCWRIGHGHSFGLMSIDRLNSIVREKETKSLEYARCDTYWLLLIVDFIDPAQEQEIRLDGLAITSAVFEKILIFKTGFNQTVDVTAARPS